MTLSRQLTIYILFLGTLFTGKSLQAQDYFELNREYYPGFPFESGVYLSLEEFKNNSPSYKQSVRKSGIDLMIESDTSDELIAVDPAKIWGYSQGGNVYVSFEGGFWRLINIGTLCHFTAVVVTELQTIDSFGFPTTVYTKSMQHLFLDVETGNIYGLNEKKLKPFLEEEPILYKKFQDKKRKKTVDFIKALKAYNELHPLRFPINE
ncbi:MAG: hypothetical protein CMP59_09725 [Flavobacteriales bacterium]|nr:hypothetical protein [Flavobacteriales bacterium]|tara:strand:- start:11 stop:631 length:621 start_codon:yes stop_codon:yes gene_type:complete